MRNERCSRARNKLDRCASHERINLGNANGEEGGRNGGGEKKIGQRKIGARAGGKMFLARDIMDALHTTIMRFYSAIRIKHWKQQKLRGEGRAGGGGRAR